jgi:Domain of unknown function (DUF4192)
MSAPAKTVVTISSPADILGVVPHRVGFHPVESIVVVCLHGPRRRDGLLMRLDLAPVEHDGVVARDLATKAAHVKATAAVLICYTETRADGDGQPRQHLIDALRQRLSSQGIEVIEALLVHNGRWWSYVCTDASCCPPEGTELATELTPAAAHYAAEVVADGGAVLTDRDALERSIRPPRNPVAEAVREQATERACQWGVGIIAAGGADALCTETLKLLRSLVRRWAGGSRELTPDEAAQVLLGLGLKSARDEAATLLLDADADVLLALLVALARYADGALAAPVCTVLAWVAYAQGNGALANVAIDRALDAEPGYEMARLLEGAMGGLIRPSAIRALTRDVRRDIRAASRSK